MYKVLKMCVNIRKKHVISNDFWHKIKNDNFDPYNVLLPIATNIHVLLMTAFVLQSHLWCVCVCVCVCVCACLCVFTNQTHQCISSC